MSGVAIHVSGETIAVWIVIGILDDSTEDIPDYMMRTSPERYYKSLEFLESLSKQIFAVKMEEVLAQEAFNKSRESEAQMKEQLHRNEAMTSILKMLESENQFYKNCGRHFKRCLRVSGDFGRSTAPGKSGAEDGGYDLRVCRRGT